MPTLLDEADSRFFLGLYRCAVKLYQPKIEERTCVSLGNIDVWDFQQVDRHIMRDLERGNFRWLLGWFRRFLPNARLQQMSENLKATYRDRVQSCTACYYKSAIYVSFEVDIRSHQEGIACAVVHELSHALWERLARKPAIKERIRTPAEHQKLQLFVEGYATYAERIWFLDLYPPCVRDILKYVRLDRQSVHYRGMQRIQDLVEGFGSAFLLQLPRQWRNISTPLDVASGS